MKRSKTFTFILVAILPFVIGLTAQVGCASRGNRKPTVFVDHYNNIPADIPSQFIDRYERFITGKEQKEFKKLLTDEDRQVFVDKFWFERDPDPSTPGNEYKQEIDDRIDDIASEHFFSGANVTGLLFRNNGGYRGDMAKVYLLHGEPDAMDTIEGNSFVPMMLWIYINSENSSIQYAFLFYQRGNSGSYVLFPQDSYQMDPCGAIYQVATLRMYNYNIGQGCSDDLYQVYDDIYRTSGRAGTLDGNLFTWALFNFSQDGSGKQEAALEPPKPAAEIAKQSRARVIGEAPKLTGTAGTDYILASCENCNSLMPAELQLDNEFALSVRRSDMDWRVTTGEAVEVELKIRVIMENTVTNRQLIVEKRVIQREQKYLVVGAASGQVVITLLTVDEVAQIPAGTYRLSIYIENVLTNKYNAWSKELVVK